MQANAEMKPERNQKAKQIENVVDKTFFHQVSSGVVAFRDIYPSSDLLAALEGN